MKRASIGAGIGRAGAHMKEPALVASISTYCALAPLSHRMRGVMGARKGNKPDLVLASA
ncbi:hypothetical protein AA105894_2542 [Asaia spathodeae NBRC 105894]|nr:hypothetical protein AA105894_2542 [Asaia spathodeae NBRC 105894]